MATAPSSDAVQVIIRVRPLNTKETNENRKSIVGIDPAVGQISLENSGKADQPSKDFTFDAVYGEESAQKVLYDESCFPLVESVLEGFNGTIFAYGQTGCGKTHTMQGYANPSELRGVIPASFDHIFEYVRASQGIEFLVRCSYLEIYNEEIRDLLGNDQDKKYELKEDPTRGVFVKDLTEVIVEDVDSCNEIMMKGQDRRTTGATLMNLTSSRSHAIFTITIEMSERQEDGKDHIRMGKLNLVDLAGSERASKTGAEGDRLKEGCKINLSLSALGNVISALVDGKGKHIPYRDSKLTRMLQDSLGGNTKTLMIAAVSPADYNYDETLSTLRYANRAKNIKNKPKINEDPKDAMLRQYKEEIERLKQMLESKPSSMPERTDAVPSFVSVIETPIKPAATEEDIIQSSRRRQENEALRNQYSNVLSEKDELARALEEEKRNREKLLQTLADLEKKIVHSNDVEASAKQMSLSNEFKSGNFEDMLTLSNSMLLPKIEAPSDEFVESKNELSLSHSMEYEVKLVHVQKKMKATQRHQQRLEAENERALIEKKEVEDELKLAVESVDELKNKLSKSRKKADKRFAQAKAEIEDLQEEFERERETLLDTIRDLQKDESFWKAIVMSVTTAPQLDRINSLSKYDDDEGKWFLPKLRFGNTGIEVIELPAIAIPLVLPEINNHRVIHKSELMNQKEEFFNNEAVKLLRCSETQGQTGSILSNTLPTITSSVEEPQVPHLRPIKGARPRQVSARTRLATTDAQNSLQGDSLLPKLEVPRTARSTNDISSLSGLNLLATQINSHPCSATVRNPHQKRISDDSLPVVRQAGQTSICLSDINKNGDSFKDWPILPPVNNYVNY